VEPGHEAIDDPAGDELNMAERREGCWVVQIRARGCAHRGAN
jgi:hypothetical protein